MFEKGKPSTRKPGEHVWCERSGRLLVPIPGRHCMMGFQVWVVQSRDGAVFTECEDRLRDVLRVRGDCDARAERREKDEND